MKLIEFGSGTGIAGEFGFKSIYDVLYFIPFDNMWEGQPYVSKDILEVQANFTLGSSRTYAFLEQEWERSHACSNEPTTAGYADPIGKQLAEWENKGCKATSLILHRTKLCSYQSDQDVDYWEFVPLNPINWNDLKYRIEEALWKNHNKQTLWQIAQCLDVTIYE